MLFSVQLFGKKRTVVYHYHLSAVILMHQDLSSLKYFIAFGNNKINIKIHIKIKCMIFKYQQVVFYFINYSYLNHPVSQLVVHCHLCCHRCSNAFSASNCGDLLLLLVCLSFAEHDFAKHLPSCQFYFLSNVHILLCSKPSLFRILLKQTNINEVIMFVNKVLNN